MEDRIRAAKACGLRNFPFEDFVSNQAWLAMVLIAQDLLAWTAMVCLDGAMAKAEPATLRYRLLHVGARLARRGRDLHLRIDENWPWAVHIDAALVACVPLSAEASPGRRRPRRSHRGAPTCQPKPDP